MSHPSRRFVLACSSRLAALGALRVGVPLAGAGGLSGSGCAGGGGPQSAGNAADIAVGELVAFSGFVLGRDADGLYAMTAICTHLGCDISASGTVNSGGLSCDCHGSTFDASGEVTNGPATAALDHLEVTVDEAGEITVDTSVTVWVDARVAVEGDTGG